MNIQTMMYKDLEWYIINETEKEKLLFLKDCFTNEMIQKFFKKYDEYFDVVFNENDQKIWWKDSYIRRGLNGPFLNFLDINDLNIMKTTLEFKNKKSTVKDYVRLITKEEVEILSKEILISKKNYWTMTPKNFFIDSGVVYCVKVTNNSNNSNNSNNFLSGFWITASLAIRPIISLKQDYNKPKIITTGFTPEQLENIKRLQKLRKI